MRAENLHRILTCWQWASCQAPSRSHSGRVHAMNSPRYDQAAPMHHSKYKAARTCMCVRMPAKAHAHAPHAAMMVASHVGPPTALRIRLEGICSNAYLWDKRNRM